MLEFVLPPKPSDSRAAVKLAYCENGLCVLKDHFDIVVDFIFGRAINK